MKYPNKTHDAPFEGNLENASLDIPINASKKLLTVNNFMILAIFLLISSVLTLLFSPSFIQFFLPLMK